MILASKDDEIIARAYNKKNQSNKVKDHAEMIALELANEKLENWRLEECEIYITLEPCPMCASAIEQSRIRRIVTGAQNNNEQTKLVTEQILKNRSWKKQVLEEECTELINEFFKSKR